jgi:hypothetical protein
LAELALKHHIATMFILREHVEVGGLMAYGPSFPDLFRRAAHYVDISKHVGRVNISKHVGRVNRESIVVDEIVV